MKSHDPFRYNVFIDDKVNDFPILTLLGVFTAEVSSLNCLKTDLELSVAENTGALLHCIKGTFSSPSCFERL